MAMVAPAVYARGNVDCDCKASVIFGQAGDALPQSLFREVVAGAGNVLEVDVPQVLLVQEEEMVQARLAHTVRPALANRVLRRHAVRRAQRLDAGCRGDLREGKPIRAVVIADAVLRARAERVV